MQVDKLGLTTVMQQQQLETNSMDAQHKFLTPPPTHRRDPESRWVCRAMPVGRGGGWVQHPLAGTKMKREAGGEESQHEPHGLEGASVDRSLANWQAMLEHKTSRELRNLCPPTHRAALAWAPHLYWCSPSATIDSALDPLREYVSKHLPEQDQETDPTFHDFVDVKFLESRVARQRRIVEYM